MREHNFILLKDRLRVNRSLKCLQSFLNDALSELLLLFCRHLRIAERIRDRDSRNDTVSTNRHRDRGYGCDVNNRNAVLLNVLYKRCSATRAGSSRRGQDDSVNMIVNELLSDLCAVLLGRSYSGTVSYS